MKMIFMLLVSGFFVISCSSDGAKDFNNEDFYPYYKFNQNDLNYRLLNLSLNQELIFINQNNEIVKFKVIQNELKKLENGSGTFSGGSITQNYYDAQVIKLKSITDNFEEAYLKLKIYKFDNQKINISFYFYKWNVYSSSEYMQGFNLNNSTVESLSIGLVNYQQVIKINSNFTKSIPSSNNYNRNVNVLFYDKLHGVIGFNDLDGNLWRKQN